MVYECENCGRDLSGVPLVAPWEDGTNECGYKVCPNCGFENEDFSDLDD